MQAYGCCAGIDPSVFLAERQRIDSGCSAIGILDAEKDFVFVVFFFLYQRSLTLLFDT